MCLLLSTIIPYIVDYSLQLFFTVSTTLCIYSLQRVMLSTPVPYSVYYFLQLLLKAFTTLYSSYSLQFLLLSAINIPNTVFTVLFNYSLPYLLFSDIIPYTAYYYL